MDGCSDWRFSGEDIKGLLRLIKGKLKPSASTAQKDLVCFLMALRRLSRFNLRLGQFVRDILDGVIAPCRESKKPGLASFLFSKRQLADYAGRHRRLQLGEVFNATEAAKYLKVTKDVIYFLVRAGILQSRDRMGGFYSDLLVSKGNLEYFESAYFLTAKVAPQLGTVSVHLTKLLIARGVQPISGPKTDGGRQYVFRKADLGIIDMADLVSTARAQHSNSEERKLQRAAAA